MAHCFSCSAELPYKAPYTASQVGRRDECPKCRSDVHACKNCQFYDTKSYNECKEPQADRMADKDRSNFCDFFTLADRGANAVDEKARLKAMADSLFKKS